MVHGGEPIPGAASEEINDARMAVAIKNKLSRVDRRAFSSIEVTVQDGVAILTGTTDTLWTQQRATELSQVIRGVRGVIDRVSVGPAEPANDSALKTQLERLFRDDPVVERKDIHLRLQDGIVTLEGQVQSWQEKQMALDLAKMVKGIREVRDALTVQVVSGRPDSALREEIVRRLAFDVWIRRPSLLKVDVRDGIVILNGRVGNAYEKHRVAELAWIEGIRDVDAKEVRVEWDTPDPMVRTHRPNPPDQEIAEAIRKVLESDRRVSRFAIQVEVKKGLVTLNGEVPFLSIKRDAEQDVNNTLGVRSVENLINVRSDTSLSDADIRTRIDDALSREPVLKPFVLDVSVRRGTALLTGAVDSIYERNLAENVSSHVPGVSSLVNQIVFTKPEIEKTDWEIQLDIDNQVWWSPFLTGQDIVATVEDGKATLTGSVEHVHQRILAEQQAFEAGASLVINHLRVGKRQPPPAISGSRSRLDEEQATEHGMFRFVQDRSCCWTNRNSHNK